MPNDAAVEKYDTMRAFGATVERVPPVNIAHVNHPVNKARRAAEEAGGLFLDQFENLANMRAHVTTGRSM